MTENGHYNVLLLPEVKKDEKSRKSGLNRNKDGSVRKINGLVYVDFVYLGERVRESSGLPWNEKNVRTVRGQLDSIVGAIKAGTFRFDQTFPDSKKKEHFRKMEMVRYGLKRRPEEISFREPALKWYKLLSASKRVRGRTLRGYKSILDNYLIPFFGDMTFGRFNKVTFEEFIAWARARMLRKKSLDNTTINKLFVPLRMICEQVTVEHGWGGTFDPFFKYKKLPESDPTEKIDPFPLPEQEELRKALPKHWRPYFAFAFRAGPRPGEQIAVKPEDIDWEKGKLRVRRAMTLDEEGKLIEGGTKNRYSRRTIKLTEPMLAALKEQKKLHDKCGGEYFFCTPSGGRVDLSHLRRDVWIPALKKANLRYREMKQTRHSFATNALNHGENPLWIAKVMGHRDAEMVFKVYSKLIENARGVPDGAALTAAYRAIRGSKKGTKRNHE